MGKTYERPVKPNTNIGKLPPQALDLEEFLLAALMLNRNAIYEVLDLIKPEMFYKESHQIIYRACINLHTGGNPVDMTTVGTELRRMGKLEEIGGHFELIEITDKNKGFSNFDYWCRIIMQKYLQRELIRNGMETINEAYDDTADPFEILGTVSKFVSEAEVGFIGSNEKHISDITNEITEARKTAPQNDQTIHGLETGVYELDKLLDGFSGGELIVIAARPAMGKTAVLCSFAKFMNIDRSNPIAIFSLEMSYRQIFLRLESNASGINGNKIKRNNLDAQEQEILNQTDEQLKKGSLIIDDKSFINISQVISRIRMYVRKYKIKGVLIDYLQLIQGLSDKPGNREVEISQMTRALKVCAGELNIPIVILSQLSRAVESRPGLKIPQLSDLRESGAIEQDADKVIFLWRPEYYNIQEPTTFRLFNKTIDNKNLLVYIVAKHREGELGQIPALFTPWNMRVTNHPDLLLTQEIAFPSQNLINPLNPNEYSYNPDEDQADENDLPF